MKLKYFLISAFYFFFSVTLLGQSDFRITQEFKSRQRSFEIAIEYAKSIDEIEKIKKEIAGFKGEFKGNKELLNRALYPSNFESSFVSLDKKIEFATKKLTEISTLQTQVSKISSDYEKVSGELQKISREVNSLKNSNRRLMTQLKAFQSGYGGSKEEIDSLKNLVAELKLGISKRDTLIKDIMDDIFTSADNRITSLNDVEMKTIRTKIQGTSLIANIESLINDNIEFLNSSTFTKEDLSALSNEYSDFNDRWSQFGPKLFNIYSSDQKNQEKLNNIDSLLINWENALSFSIWTSINRVFSENNIILAPFNSGEEFERVIIEYIDAEINNNAIDVKKDQNYVFFAERTWKELFKPNWMPLLISKNLLSIENITNIENKLEEWKEASGSSKSYFIYGIIIILAIAIFISIYFVIRKKSGNTEENESNFDDSEKIKTEED